MNENPGEYNLEVKDRVHIMPLGYEEERAYLAAEALKADSVILIRYGDEPDQDRNHIDNIQSELDERGIQHRLEKCDIFDMFDSLGMIAELIDSYSDEDVYVNVSTGGKITAIAGMIACMVTGATPYYVQANDYDVTPPEGISEITELPRYPITAPDPQHIEILHFIKNRLERENPPTKGDLIDYGERSDLPFISNYDVEDKSKYRLLDNQIIDPLVEDGYITVKKIGREKVVEITPDGRKTLHAFRYLIENGLTES